MTELIGRLAKDTDALVSGVPTIVTNGRSVGGASLKRARREFFITLGQLFKDGTGHDWTVSKNDAKEAPYSGSFFSFVEYCLAIVNEPMGNC